MANSTSRRRANRRERRKAKASGWRRPGKAKPGRVGHGVAGGRMLGGPASAGPLPEPAAEHDLGYEPRKRPHGFKLGDAVPELRDIEPAPPRRVRVLNRFFNWVWRTQ